MRSISDVKVTSYGASKAKAFGLSSLSYLSALPCNGPQVRTLKCVFYRVSKAYAKGKRYDRKCPQLVTRRQRYPGQLCQLPPSHGIGSTLSSILITPFWKLDLKL